MNARTFTLRMTSGRRHRRPVPLTELTRPREGVAQRLEERAAAAFGSRRLRHRGITHDERPYEVVYVSFQRVVRRPHAEHTRAARAAPADHSWLMTNREELRSRSLRASWCRRNTRSCDRTHAPHPRASSRSPTSEPHHLFSSPFHSQGEVLKRARCAPRRHGWPGPAAPVVRPSAAPRPPGDRLVRAGDSARSPAAPGLLRSAGRLGRSILLGPVHCAVRVDQIDVGREGVQACLSGMSSRVGNSVSRSARRHGRVPPLLKTIVLRRRPR